MIMVMVANDHGDADEGDDDDDGAKHYEAFKTTMITMPMIFMLMRMGRSRY